MWWEAIEFLVAPSQGWSDLTGHYGVCQVDLLSVCPSVDSYKNVQNITRFQKFQSQNMFQAILSNFYFWTPTSPQDLVLCRFGLIHFWTRSYFHFTLHLTSTYQKQSYGKIKSQTQMERDITDRIKILLEGHTKSKTGAISGSTKWTLVQTKNFKKKKNIAGRYHEMGP